MSIIRIIKFVALYLSLVLGGLMGILFIEVLLAQQFGSDFVFPSFLVWFVWIVISYFITRRFIKRLEKLISKSKD